MSRPGIRGEFRCLAPSIWRAMAGFVLCGYPTVTATPISSVGRIPGIAIRFWNFLALSRRDQKLFPHFGETGTAIFAVNQVKYGGHDRTPF